MLSANGMTPSAGVCAAASEKKANSDSSFGGFVARIEPSETAWAGVICHANASTSNAAMSVIPIRPPDRRVPAVFKPRSPAAA